MVFYFVASSHEAFSIVMAFIGLKILFYKQLLCLLLESSVFLLCLSLSCFFMVSHLNLNNKLPFQTRCSACGLNILSFKEVGYSIMNANAQNMRSRARKRSAIHISAVAQL